MTQVIDERVVEMRFDNAEFEKNVSQSLATLEKLKQALNINSVKALDGLTSSLKSFDLTSVGSAVDTVQASFSALQVVGMTALSEITKSAMNLGATIVSKVVEPIKTGGLNRALNIEQAKFQLNGLGIAWEEVYDDINYAVKGTAYGLDEAANAASQLSASNVKLGTDMKAALRGISGVAAMTNAQYTDIAEIFTSVAGKGKAMAADFNRIGARGLNAKAAVADYMNAVSDGTIEVSDSMSKMVKEITGGIRVTEADIASFASKSKINFEIFSKALDSAFGEHAKAANDTYTGAMRNVRAAFSRIGANFATPYLENMRLIAVEGIKVIDTINAELKPVYSEVSQFMQNIQERITRFMKAGSVKTGITALIDGITNAFHAFILVTDPVREAFREIFPKQNAIKSFREAAEAFRDFTNKLVLSKKDTENFKKTMKGLFSVLDMVRIAFTQVVDAIKPYSSNLKNIASDILEVTGKLGDSLTKLRDFVKENNIFGKAFRTTAFAIQVSVRIIKNAFDDLVNGLKEFKKNHIDDKDFSGITNFIDRVKERLKSLKSVGDFIKAVFSGIAETFESFKPVLSSFGELFSALIGGVLKGFSDAFGKGNMNAMSAFLSMMSSLAAGNMIMNGANMLSTISNTFSQLFKTIKTAGGLTPILTTIKTEFTKTFAKVQADLKADVLLRLGKAIALFAGSLFVLSMVDEDKLLGALGVMAAIMGMFSFALGGINKLTTSISSLLPFTDVLKNAFNNLANSVSQFVKMQALSVLGNMLIKASVAVLILAAAIKSIGSLKPDQLVGGLGSVLVLLTALYKMAENFANKDVFKQKSIMRGAGQLILLASSIRILASAVKVIGQLELDQVLQGVGSVIVIMFSLTEMLQKLNGKSLNVGTGFALVETAGALIIIAQAISMLGKLKPDEILQGGIAAGIIGGALAVFIKVVSEMGNLGDMGSTATAVLALATAIFVVAESIKVLGTLQPEQIAAGMTALGVSLVAMAAGLKILSENSDAAKLMSTSGALALFAGSMLILASAIAILATQDPVAVAASIAALAVAIFGFAAVAKLLDPLTISMLKLAGSFALFGVGVLAAGAGIALLAAAIQMLVDEDPLAVCASLMALIVGLAAFAAIASALGPTTIVPMLLFAAGVAAVGVAALICAASITVMGSGLAIIASLGTAGAIAIEAVAAAFLALSLGIVAFSATSLVLSAAIIGMAASVAVFGVSVLATTVLVGALALAFAVATPISAAFALTIGALALAMATLAASLVVVFAALGEVSPALAGFSENIFNMFADFKKGILDKIEDFKKAIQNKVGDMIQLGKDFISGFLDGLKDVPILGGIISAAENIADTAIGALKNRQKSNSPSKVTEAMGEDFSMGYGKGIDNTESKTKVEKSSEKLADAAIGELEDTPDEAREIGSNTSEQLGLGLLENLPFVKNAADQIRSAADLSDVEFGLSSKSYTAEEYVARQRLKHKDALTKADRDRAKAKEGLILGILKEEEAVKKETEAEDANTAATKKNSSAKSEKKSILETLKDNLESQMSIFSKFELKTEMSSEQLLENMKSNLDAYASWSARLVQLQERGISKLLFEKLMEMGPKEYEIVNAMVNMTDEQLQQANEMYTASLAMDDAVIAQIAPSYEKLGGEIPKGVAAGIKAWQDETTAAVKAMSEAGQKEFKDDNGIASPSTVYKEYGKYIIEGLRQGINDSSMLIFLENTIRLVSKWHVLEIFKTSLTYEEFYSIGTNCLEGLLGGLSDEGLIGAIEGQISYLCGLIESVASLELEINSPSHVMQRVGNSVGEGLVLGISECADSVISATDMVVDGAIDRANRITGINDVINANVDFNPVITPMLDLSYLRSQIGDLNRLMESSAIYGGAAIPQNGGYPYGYGVPQINYTQNNYSPKALSRVEIYRQTQNQLNTMKGVVKANA